MQKSFKASILDGKNVAVWGAGYLGYTTSLQLQRHGFTVQLHDFDKPELAAEVAARAYPTPEQSMIWAKFAQAPVLDPASVRVCSDPENMFGAPVHVICCPMRRGTATPYYQDILATFRRNVERLHGCLVLLTATETPGTLEKYFIRPLLEAGAGCSFACALRSDWRLEEFFADQEPRPVAGWDTEAYCRAELFLELLGVRALRLASIKDAEVFVSARNALGYTVAAFMNQLALSYPDVDVRSMAPLLARSVRPGEIEPGVGNVGFKVANSIEHLLSGSSGAEPLPSLREAQSTNFASILFHAEHVRRLGARSAAILGLAAGDSLKDVNLSPSILLAEYLHKLGMEVAVDDPNFSPDEMQAALPFARCLDLRRQRLDADAVFLMNDLAEYRSLTQQDLLHNGLAQASIIVDNTGLLKDYEIPCGTRYVRPGDGRIGGRTCAA